MFADFVCTAAATGAGAEAGPSSSPRPRRGRAPVTTMVPATAPAAPAAAAAAPEEEAAPSAPPPPAATAPAVTAGTPPGETETGAAAGGSASNTRGRKAAAGQTSNQQRGKRGGGAGGGNVRAGGRGAAAGASGVRRKGRVSSSAKAGLVFPVARVKGQLRKMRVGERLGAGEVGDCRERQEAGLTRRVRNGSGQVRGKRQVWVLEKWNVETKVQYVLGTAPAVKESPGQGSRERLRRYAGWELRRGVPQVTWDQVYCLLKIGYHGSRFLRCVQVFVSNGRIQ